MTKKGAKMIYLKAFYDMLRWTTVTGYAMICALVSIVISPKGKGKRDE